MNKLLFLFFMFPLLAFGQTFNWEQIDPIPATVRITTPADTDFILIQKVGGFKQRVSYEDFKAGLNPWDHIEYVPQDTTPSFEPYRTWYNNEKHAITTYTENPLVALDNGEELWTPLVINNNGSNILDGQPVYSTGDIGGIMTVMLGDESNYESSRIIGLATLPIAIGDTGRITRFGNINLDLTSANINVGDIYLDKTNPPLYISNTKTTNGKWLTYLGKCLKNGVNGKIFVMPYQTERTAEQNDETGWPELVTSTLSFNETTREFSLSPTGTFYYWYENGEKYTSTGQSDIIPDEDGQYLFYQDNGAMTYIKNPSLFQAEPLVRSNALIAWVNWDADDKELIFFEDERHKRANYYSRLLHVLIHFSPDLGTQYLFGLEIQDLVVDGTGNSDTHAQFGVESGGITDEDLFKIIGQQSVPSTIPVYYRAGADGDWMRDVQTNFAQLNAIGGRMQYNQWTGTTWQLTEMTNGYYAPIYIYATGGITNKITSVVSQQEYSALADMNIAALKDDALQDMGQNPFTEARLIGIIGAHTRSNFSNAVQTRFVSLEDLLGEDADYIDYRVTGSSGGGGGGTGTTVTAADVSYSNTISGLFSTNVQDAIDEIVIDSFPVFSTDINNNSDSLSAHRIDIDENIANISINSDSIAQHRIEINTLNSNMHAPVTLTGESYLSISGQEITADKIDYNTEIDNIPDFDDYSYWDLKINSILYDRVNSTEFIDFRSSKTITANYDDGALPSDDYAYFELSDSVSSVIQSLDTMTITSHGYLEGDVITYDAKARANNAYNADVIGIVYEVIDANTFTYKYSGIYDKGTWINGMSYFLSTTVAGETADTTQLYDIGDVYLFLGTGVDGGLLLEIDVGYEFVKDSAYLDVPLHIYNELPIGVQNGVNQTFTLANTPVGGSVRLYRNGMRQAPTSDFTESGSTIIITIPPEDDLLIVDYEKF